MTRALGSFLLLFSVLSLLVHLTAMSEFLGILGILVLSLDVMAARSKRVPRRLSRGMRRDPLI